MRARRVVLGQASPNFRRSPLAAIAGEWSANRSNIFRQDKTRPDSLMTDFFQHCTMSLLSADRKVEQCGWLKDKFGLSWQIVPTVMDEMLHDKNETNLARASYAFLKMKKFDIAKLKEAYGRAGQLLIRSVRFVRKSETSRRAASVIKHGFCGTDFHVADDGDLFVLF